MKQYLVTISCVLFTFQFSLAGNLEPSAPPGGTMKTLDQVEPRIPITSLPFTISASGSYYLTNNLATSQGGGGITIEANNVTIDFCGYSITGSNTNYVYGIYMAGRKNVEIRNGTICNFCFGIYESNSAARGHRIINMRILSNLAIGINLVGNGHLISGCVISNNGTANYPGATYGMYVGSRSTAKNNNITENGGAATDAFYGLLTGSGCIVVENNISDNCTSSQSQVFGLYAGENSVVQSNTVCGNGTLGYNARGLTTGHNCTVLANTVTSNATSGGGTKYGIYCGSYCLIDNNVANANGGTNLFYGANCKIGLNVP